MLLPYLVGFTGEPAPAPQSCGTGVCLTWWWFLAVAEDMPEVFSADVAVWIFFSLSLLHCLALCVRKRAVSAVWISTLQCPVRKKQAIANSEPVGK